MAKPPKETKSEKFVRIVEARVNKIIKMVRLIGNCANTANYGFNAKDVEIVFNALQKELDKVKHKFDIALRERKLFSLSDTEDSEQTFPYVTLELPDGTSLKASAVNDENFPAINIDLLDENGNFADHICFTEYNPEHPAGHEINIGVYEANSEDTKYYHPFVPKI